jgi:hypothetical protein
MSTGGREARCHRLRASHSKSHLLIHSFANRNTSSTKLWDDAVMSNATSHRHDLKNCETILAQAGRRVDDFVFTFFPDDGFREREIRVFENIIRVTNKTTSRTRLYALNEEDTPTSGTDWTVDFTEDLAMGKLD